MGKKTKNALKKVAIGAAVAGAAGYVAGVLSAPKEGRKTRKQLKKTADRSVAEVEKQLKQLHHELGEMVDHAKDTANKKGEVPKKLSGAVQGAKQAKDKLRTVLSSVHEGEATDKDLRKALEDAKRSLNHLKKFIKK